jgi:NADP-reducing hydrogenase subunit HndB
MTFMKSLEELLAIKEKAQAQLAARDSDGNDGIRVVVGMATCGIAAGARPVLKALVDEVAKRNVQHVSVTQTGCIGMCQYEPIVEIFEPGKEKVTYVQMTAEKAQKVVAEHLVNGKPVVEYTVGAVTK